MAAPSVTTTTPMCEMFDPTRFHESKLVARNGSQGMSAQGRLHLFLEPLWVPLFLCLCVYCI